MFQPPVNNLEKIRKARKRVKQLLLQIGLDTCREAYEEINTNNPGDTNFSSTSWEDVSLWEAIGRRNGYRSKQFCCSLCKFSTRLLSSFKSHLHRYHEEEKDQEIMAACPRCPFTSYTDNVVKHMRIFHSSVRKAISPVSRDGQNSSWSKESPKAVQMKFSCLKCPFTDSLYYTVKRHVLMSHHKSEFENYFGEKTEEELKGTLGTKGNLDNRFYCKKCSYTIHNHDALMYHILTSDKHRDLEQKLRTDISDAGRSTMKRPYRKLLTPPVALSPKPLLAVPMSVTPPSAQDAKVASLPQNGPSKPPLGASTAIISNLVPSLTSVPDPAGGLIKTSTTVAPTAQVGFVTSALSQNQTITLPQSVFLSPRFTLNQPVTATVLPSPCSVGGQVIPGGQTSVRPTVLPINQPLAGGLLHVNQSTMLTCPQPIQSNVLQMNQTVRPTVISVNQPLKQTNVSGNQPGLPQNTFLAAPIIRQLIPTGKQVNGIPTYTLVTLPVAPCAIPAVPPPANPPKVPVQLSQPEKVVQVSTSPASAPSPPVVKKPQGKSQKTPPPKPTPSNSPAVAPSDKTKQWKTCPVCNELFPSNVYEVHMQIAHIKQENSPDRPTESATSNETKQPVVAAAHASFLKVLKEKSIRCVTCKSFVDEKAVLNHLLMHGMVCLYCKAVFYELRNFIYHMKILHVDKKKIHGDFVRKGITLSCDNNGTALFPHFDFSFNVSKEELGEKEMHIAVVTGANSNTAAPLYLKIQTFPERSSTDSKQSSKCSFCDHVLSRTESMETHLKDRHHIMPTMHTILRSPAFKCIHCCGVYTGSMTLSAIALHLQRCRNAPKDSIAALELCSDSNAKGQSKGGTNDNAKGKPSSTEVGSNDTKNIQKNGLGASKDSSPVPSKKRKFEPKTEFSDLPIDQNISMLVMVPDSSATVSHEAKKEFLLKYFHVKPYPSKKEIELLAHVLDMWRSDVAGFFGTRRYVCMKFLKNHKQQVLLGFKMEDLKQVKHDIDLTEDY